MVILLLLACAAPTSAPADTADAPDRTDTADSAPDTGGTVETGDTADSAAVDADHDGYTVAAGDCDDTNDRIHPGAPDYCDGVDADCDGEPIPDGSCSEAGDVEAMWSWKIESGPDFEVWPPQVGDVSGDGLPDLFTDGHPTGEEGGYLLVDTTPLGERQRISSWPEPSWNDGWPALASPGRYPIADSTGDELGDMWVLTTGNGFPGALFLFPGRTGGFPSEDVPYWQGAVASWYDDDVRTVADYPGTGIGDLTGDGLADVLLEVDDGFRMALVAGDPEATGEHTWSEVPAMWMGGFGGPGVFSDLDGDGLDEIALWTGGGQVAFLSGADWVNGGDAVDAVSILGEQVAGVEGVSFEYTMDDADDIDGDGLNDALLTDYSAEHDFCSLLLTGGIPSGDVADWTHAKVCGEGMDAEPWRWIDDLDGDGVRDFTTHVDRIVVSGPLRAGGTFQIEDLQTPRYEWGAGLTDIVDLDGDGRPEWVYWNSDDFSVQIIAGFDFPWDDPSKW